MRIPSYFVLNDSCTWPVRSLDGFSVDGRAGLPIRFLIAVIIGLMVIPVDGASGQTPFTRPYLPSVVSVEAVRPAYENDAVGATTGALFLSGSYTLNENTELVAELPLAHASGDGVASSTAIGNPLIGLALSSTRIPLLVELGGRVPLADGSLAAELGQAADYGRGASFLENESQAYLLGNTRITLGEKLSMRLRGGLAFGAFEEDNAAGTAVTQQDFRLRYAVQFWREGDWLIGGLSFTGRGTLTAPGPYDQKSRHHMALTFLLDTGKIAPGITLGVPLNGPDRDVAPFVFGASLEMRLW